jgi:tRNA modification GTPase
MLAGDATATLHTPPGRGGIAVIVLAGPGRRDALAACFAPRSAHHTPTDNALQLGQLLDEAGETLDEIVVARSPDALELNIHGGPVVARAALHRLQDLGVTILQAGDAGPTFNPAHPQWANPAIGRELLDLLPTVTAPRVADALSQQWAAGVSELASQSAPDAAFLRAAAGRLTTMSKLLSPPTVVLAGVPNTGKSTLANALAGRAVSIVHGMAGTTRDWVAAPILLTGLPVTLIDTAGLFEVQAADDPHGIDQASIARARDHATRADLVLLLSTHHVAEIPDWLTGRDVLRVVTQCDRAPADAAADANIATHTGQGIEELKSLILARLGLDAMDIHAPAAFTERQATLLTQAANALDAGDVPLARTHLDALLRG